MRKLKVKTISPYKNRSPVKNRPKKKGITKVTRNEIILILTKKEEGFNATQIHRLFLPTRNIETVREICSGKYFKKIKYPQYQPPKNNNIFDIDLYTKNNFGV